MGKPLVSVIVPVYNMEKYLEECVTSILNQTYPEFELILVDDGSLDSSGAMVDAWGQKENRVVVIHERNKGLSGARNTGIDKAQGEYLVFVDSDDYVAPDYIEVLLQTALAADADMAMCGVYALFQDDCCKASSMPMQARIYTPQTYMERFYVNTGFFSVVWNKIYKKRLFDTVRFFEGRLNEDTIIMPRLIAQVNQVAYVPEPLYFYRQRKGSIMHTAQRKSGIQNLLQIYEDLIQQHEEKNEEHLCRLAQKVYMNKSFEHFSELERSERPEIRKKQKEYCNRLLTYSKISVLVKAKLLLFTYFPGLYEKINRKKVETRKFFE